MYNHEPKNYQCPFCLLVRGIENEHVYSRQSDIVYSDKHITALIASHWWPNNPGHVVIIPNKHIENIYDLPSALSARIHDLEKEVAIAFKKAYKSHGVSSRQHNEHAGNQDVWHYHLHVFPRYDNDNFYLTHKKKKLSTPSERKKYAQKLKNYFNKKKKR